MNNESEGNETSSRYFSKQSVDAFSDYYIPAVIVFGYVGNIAFIIACRLCSTLKQCRFVACMIAWSISDTVFLLCLGLVWLKGIGVNWHDLAGVCTVATFLSNASSLLSSWYVAGMTCELACSSRNPHRVYNMMTRRNYLWKRVTAMTLIGLVANAWTLAMARSVPVQPAADPFLSASGSSPPGTILNRTSTVSKQIFVCQIRADKDFIFGALTVYDILLGVIVPLCATLVSLGVITAHWIMKRLWGHKEKRKAALSLISYQWRRPSRSHGFCGCSPDAGHTNCDGDMTAAGKLRRRSSPDAGPARIGFEHLQTPESMDGEYRMLIVAGTSGFGLKRASIGKLRGKHLLSPARYHAMLHRHHFEKCLRIEWKVTPVLILKSIVYVALSLPHCAYRFWFMLGDQQAHFSSVVVYFLFYTQFALNAFLLLLYGCNIVIHRFLSTNRNRK